MSVELSPEQRRALEARPEEPLQVIDPQSQTAYVLLRADVYEGLCKKGEEDLAAKMYPLLAELNPEDWEDRADYEGLRKAP
jgi:hypothetical protein